MIALRRIQGESLAPGYRDGDFVFSSNLPYLLRKPRRGDVIVFRHPHHGVLIKRIASVEPARALVRVEGTGPDSIDSRQFGPVHTSDILGKVIRHIQKPRR
jgi:signal peptidase I